MESWRLQIKWLISKSRQKELGDKRVLADNCLVGKNLGDEGSQSLTSMTNNSFLKSLETF